MLRVGAEALPVPIPLAKDEHGVLIPQPGGLLVELSRPGYVRGGPPAGRITVGQMIDAGGKILLCGAGKPLKSQSIVPFHTGAGIVEAAQIALGGGVPLLRRAAVELRRF